MTTQRRKNLVTSRRRLDDEVEEDDGAGAVVDDSQSEASVLTDPGDNLDADDSDLSDPDSNRVQPTEKPRRTTNGAPKGPRRRKDYVSGAKDADRVRRPSSAGPSFVNRAETDPVLNGLDFKDDGQEEEAIDFEDTVAVEEVVPLSSKQSATAARPVKKETPAERRAREHEEYKAKRDSDPAFIPNRGSFFMHDQRNDSHGQPSHLGRGRGRGRGGIHNGASSARPGNLSEEAGKARWDHDLHETVVDPVSVERTNSANKTSSSAVAVADAQASGQLSSLSKSFSIGTVLMRVFLPSMEKPIKFEKVPVRQHTRLPDLRPPLRRDKAVRISLPDQAPKYIFPSTERSFIFIPRAQRPNQAGRSRNRGFFSQSASRRTSVYAGSVYTPSVAMSRRSSQARDGIASPAGSVMSKGATSTSRPVVRLPSNTPAYQAVMPPPSIPPNPTAIVGNPAQMVSMPPGYPYPLPSRPYRENRQSHIPMHQPRPQKAVSVASIESPPAQFNQAQQHQQEQQPFHYQVPSHVNGQSQPSDSSLSYAHGRQAPYMGQHTGSTPLSNIPEGAINAQPFQPTALPQGFYQPQYPIQPLYYYQTGDSHNDQYAANLMPSTMYMEPYLVPMMMPTGAPPQARDGGAAQGQPGMFAHESNGMVYYYDSSQFSNQSEGLSTMNYPVDGGQGMQTGTESYYYAQNPQSMVYYPTQ